MAETIKGKLVMAADTGLLPTAYKGDFQSWMADLFVGDMPHDKAERAAVADLLQNDPEVIAARDTIRVKFNEPNFML